MNTSPEKILQRPGSAKHAPPSTFVDLAYFSDVDTSDEEREEDLPHYVAPPVTPELLSALVKQVEFYFSDANLPTDRKLLKLVKKDPQGFVPVKVFANFRKVRAMTREPSVITQALQISEGLVLSPDMLRVKRLQAVPEFDISDMQRRILVVENLPVTPTIEMITEVFVSFGKVKVVRICLDGKGKLPQWLTAGCFDPTRQHAFVEFEEEAAAIRAATALYDAGDWRRSLKINRLANQLQYLDETRGSGGGAGGGSRARSRNESARNSRDTSPTHDGGGGRSSLPRHTTDNRFDPTSSPAGQGRPRRERRLSHDLTVPAAARSARSNQDSAWTHDTYRSGANAATQSLSPHAPQPRAQPHSAMAGGSPYQNPFAQSSAASGGGAYLPPGRRFGGSAGGAPSSGAASPTAAPASPTRSANARTGSEGGVFTPKVPKSPAWHMERHQPPSLHGSTSPAFERTPNTSQASSPTKPPVPRKPFVVPASPSKLATHDALNAMLADVIAAAESKGAGSAAALASPEAAPVPVSGTGSIFYAGGMSDSAALPSGSSGGGGKPSGGGGGGGASKAEAVGCAPSPTGSSRSGRQPKSARAASAAAAASSGGGFASPAKSSQPAHITRPRSARSSGDGSGADAAVVTSRQGGPTPSKNPMASTPTRASFDEPTPAATESYISRILAGIGGGGAAALVASLVPAAAEAEPQIPGDGMLGLSAHSSLPKVRTSVFSDAKAAEAAGVVSAVANMDLRPLDEGEDGLSPIGNHNWHKNLSMVCEVDEGLTSDPPVKTSAAPTMPPGMKQTAAVAIPAKAASGAAGAGSGGESSSALGGSPVTGSGIGSPMRRTRPPLVPGRAMAKGAWRTSGADEAGSEGGAAPEPVPASAPLAAPRRQRLAMSEGGASTPASIGCASTPASVASGSSDGDDRGKDSDGVRGPRSATEGGMPSKPRRPRRRRSAAGRRGSLSETNGEAADGQAQPPASGHATSGHGSRRNSDGGVGSDTAIAVPKAATGGKKTAKKDYASWAAATPEYRAEASAKFTGSAASGSPSHKGMLTEALQAGCYAAKIPGSPPGFPKVGGGSVEGGAGSKEHHPAHQASVTISRGPDGSQGFGMGRGKPMQPPPS